MSEKLAQARVEAIRRLARRRAKGPLRRALQKSNPRDIGAAAAHLTRAETLFLLEQIDDPAVIGEVLLTQSDADLPGLVEGLGLQEMARVLEAMAPDDEADLVSRLPPRLADRLLGLVQKEDRENVEELLAWPEDSAGGIMSPVAFRLNENLTLREAIAALQEAGDVEMVFYLYVENDAGQLVGTLSLRNLLLHPPNTRLKDVMTTDVVAVSPETDQEEVARIASRYGLLAVPVVDEGRRLLGIVTIDDVLDVMDEEAAEDLMRMAGVDESFDPHATGVLAAVRSRARWLLVTLGTGLVISEVIGRFQAELTRVPVLIGFIPVVMGMSGNVGIQAATIAVRNIATGHAGEGRTALLHLLREARTGLVMGLLFGTLLAGWGWARDGRPVLGAAVGTSITLAMVVAATMGTAVPLALRRLGVDPAVATGPFVTTSIDLVSVSVYFLVSTVVFGL